MPERPCIIVASFHAKVAQSADELAVRDEWQSLLFHPLTPTISPRNAACFGRTPPHGCFSEAAG